MKAQQITKTAGMYLGIKPDKDGFYFIRENAKITGLQLAYLLQLTQIETKAFYVQKLENSANYLHADNNR